MHTHTYRAPAAIAAAVLALALSACTGQGTTDSEATVNSTTGDTITPSSASPHTSDDRTDDRTAQGSGVYTGHPDDDTPLTGDILRQASRAALDKTGGGTVTEATYADPDDFDHTYEVEVRTAPRTKVDVDLDKEFRVVNVKTDVDDDH